MYKQRRDNYVLHGVMRGHLGVGRGSVQQHHSSVSSLHICSPRHVLLLASYPDTYSLIQRPTAVTSLCEPFGRGSRCSKASAHTVINTPRVWYDAKKKAKLTSGDGIALDRGCPDMQGPESVSCNNSSHRGYPYTTMQRTVGLPAL